MHGGTVEATSAGIGKGSRFVVRLPVKDRAQSRDSAPAIDERPRESVWERVLVADDNTDAADSLAVLLRAMGSDVRVARDGLEAIDIANAFRPEIVFMDIDMPRLNGLDAARSIRAQPWAATVVICALTGFGQDTDRARSAAAGIDYHFVKPVDTRALHSIMLR